MRHKSTAGSWPCHRTDPLHSLLASMKLLPEEVFSLSWDDWQKALARVGDRERRVLELRHGVNGADRLTLQAIASGMDCTRQWVHVIEERGLFRLGRISAEMGLIDISALYRVTPWLADFERLASGTC